MLHGHRVIALGVPVPPFPGNPLDPPLRSRFQGRRIDPAPARALTTAIRRDWAPGLDPAIARKLVALRTAIESLGKQASSDVQGGSGATVAFHELMYLGEAGVLSCAKLLGLFPSMSLREAVRRVYPDAAFYKMSQVDSKALFDGILESLESEFDDVAGYRVTETVRQGPSGVGLEFLDFFGESVQCSASGGSSTELSLPQESSTLQEHHWTLLTTMLQSHCAGKDLCLIGEKGSGKSFMARQFALALGYAPVETLFIYADMTSRDLLQRRTTGEAKETLWQPTPLAIALRTGRLAILDGVHRLPPGTISALLRLIEDREITLFDGSRYVRPSRYLEMQQRLGLSETELTARNIFPVHESFRILALATLPTKNSDWLSNEFLHLFHFFELSIDLTSEVGVGHSAALLSSVVPTLPDSVAATLSTLAGRLAAVGDDAANTMEGSLSLRTMLRIARRVSQFPDDLSMAVSMNMMSMFMPAHARSAVSALLQETGLELRDEVGDNAVQIIEADDTLTIGDLVYKKTVPENPELVPNIVFFEIPSHTHILYSMLKDYVLGEHVLLMGNQGVGKNKLTDHLLQLMNREREYIQLHRDTTVSTLTLNPSLKDGMIVWEDSPLVRAMTRGLVLVVDEFDKAPVEVVCVLKGLLEDGEILLADGRRFVSPKSVLFSAKPPSMVPSAIADLLETRVCRIHENFRVFALANRPGYPFLGNDFFAEVSGQRNPCTRHFVSVV